MPLVNKKLRYDPNHGLVSGYFVCDECGARSPVGDKSTHLSECVAVGLSSLTLCFGPKQVAIVKEMAATWGETHTWYGLSLKHLKETFPELLAKP
jgi:hypothetical protein